ncbi:zinc finger protein SNAI2-like [Aphis craccivora]|uniref:Zinc finger protein SNAI2-like n=1 Tax=Aphis craccivora TaxID=307492 RepID=A0A6G0YLX4_APHCR|nr:zinc finger protein SNAI2-like [Aphis craccivora]
MGVVCNLCQKQFASVKSLEFHKKSVHPKRTLEETNFFLLTERHFIRRHIKTNKHLLARDYFRSMVICHIYFTESGSFINDMMCFNVEYKMNTSTYQIPFNVSVNANPKVIKLEQMVTIDLFRYFISLDK